MKQPHQKASKELYEHRNIKERKGNKTKSHTNSTHICLYKTTSRSHEAQYFTRIAFLFVSFGPLNFTFSFYFLLKLIIICKRKLITSYPHGTLYVINDRMPLKQKHYLTSSFSTSSLTWFFWLVTKHPLVEAKILEEIKDNFEANYEGVVGIEEVKEPQIGRAHV